MGSWFIGKVLPGLTTSAVWAVLLWVSHRKLWRRIEKLTNDQTAELSGRDPQSPGGT